MLWNLQLDVLRVALLVWWFCTCTFKVVANNKKHWKRENNHKDRVHDELAQRCSVHWISQAALSQIGHSCRLNLDAITTIDCRTTQYFSISWGTLSGVCVCVCVCARARVQVIRYKRCWSRLLTWHWLWSACPCPSRPALKTWWLGSFSILSN